MPITTSILEHEVLGPLFKKGLLEERQEGELAILRRLIEKRFGALPVWASDKLAVLQASKTGRLERAGAGCPERGRIAEVSRRNELMAPAEERG
jgi:hypothetical protein